MAKTFCVRNINQALLSINTLSVISEIEYNTHSACSLERGLYSAELCARATGQAYRTSNLVLNIEGSNPLTVPPIDL